MGSNLPDDCFTTSDLTEYLPQARELAENEERNFYVTSRDIENVNAEIVSENNDDSNDFPHPKEKLRNYVQPDYPEEDYNPNHSIEFPNQQVQEYPSSIHNQYAELNVSEGHIFNEFEHNINDLEGSMPHPFHRVGDAQQMSGYSPTVTIPSHYHAPPRNQMNVRTPSYGNPISVSNINEREAYGPVEYHLRNQNIPYAFRHGSGNPVGTVYQNFSSPQDRSLGPPVIQQNYQNSEWYQEDIQQGIDPIPWQDQGDVQQGVDPNLSFNEQTISDIAKEIVSRDPIPWKKEIKMILRLEYNCESEEIQDRIIKKVKRLKNNLSVRRFRENTNENLEAMLARLRYLEWHHAHSTTVIKFFEEQCNVTVQLPEYPESYRGSF